MTVHRLSYKCVKLLPTTAQFQSLQNSVTGRLTRHHQGIGDKPNQMAYPSPLPAPSSLASPRHTGGCAHALLELAVAGYMTVHVLKVGMKVCDRRMGGQVKVGFDEVEGKEKGTPKWSGWY